LDAWSRTASAHRAQFWSSREKNSIPWAVEGDEGQIVVRYGEERCGKLTFWLTGDRNGQGVDIESAKDEGNGGGFGEHDDRECREKKQITTAPGLGCGR